jgi:S1-C subfamily serine protease
MMIATVLPLVAAWSNLLGDSNMGKAIANMLQGSLSFNEQRHHRHIESESDEDAAENTPGADAEINKQLKYSIVRFMTEVKQLSLLKPWQLQGRQVFAGTGFAIRSTDNGPLIVTNAHVVTDADNVMIQIPAYGSQEYKARVVMLNPDMDIALVEFQPGEHKKFVDEVKKDIPILDFYTKPVNLATPVVALGFPLGQKTAKLTTGVISGHEKVGDYMSFQQTASISPGNSGGPLFVKGTNKVLAINFAAAVGSSSQQNNYAIPIWHVNQMLAEYDASTSLPPPKVGASNYRQNDCRDSHSHCVYKVPKVKGMAALGNEALFKRFGCDKGVFLTRWGNASLFNFATPPFPDKVFVQSVGGYELDEFGMAKTESYFEDPVRFDDLFFLSNTLGSVDVKVCSCGKISTHKIETSGLRDHVPKQTITTLTEPNVFYKKHTNVYENFGGLTVQPLTMNIIKSFVEQKNMGMVKYAMSQPANPLLVVTGVSVFGTKEHPHTIAPGDVVASVNGQKVSTIAEFRSAFKPTGVATCGDKEASLLQGAEPLWSLETESGKEYVVPYKQALETQKAAIAAGNFPLTEAVKAALGTKQNIGISFSEGTDASQEKPEVVPIEMRDVPRFGDKEWNAMTAAFSGLDGIAM